MYPLAVLYSHLCARPLRPSESDLVCCFNCKTVGCSAGQKSQGASTPINCNYTVYQTGNALHASLSIYKKVSITVKFYSTLLIIECILTSFDLNLWQF